MSRPKGTRTNLSKENEILRARLEEAEEALRAIREGDVDALVVYREGGEKIYTLEGADHPYRVMVESIHEGAATIQNDGLILYSNHRLAEMLEVPLEDFLGDNLLPYVDPKDRETFEGLLASGFQGPWKTEVVFITCSGASLPVLVSINPVEVNEFRGLCLVATDLTEQKRSDEILAAERMARSILDQAGEAILVCDKTGIVRRASQATHKLAGENPLFKTFEAVFPLTPATETEQKTEFSLDLVLQGESYRGLEVLFDRKASSLSTGPPSLNLILSAAPLRNQDQEILGCIVTLTDITEQKQAEKFLKNANAELEFRVQVRTQELRNSNNQLWVEIEERTRAEGSARQSALEAETLTKELEKSLHQEIATHQQLIQAEKHSALSRMVGSVAHEINNPVQTIRNCLYLLNQNQDLGEENREVLAMALDETKRVGKLVERLKETYRPTKSNLPELFNIIEVLTSVRDLLQPHLQHNRVAWVMEERLPAIVINGIADQVKQVFLNISMNAIEAMQPNGGVLTVKVLPSSNHEVGISFTDTGPGIRQENRNKVFEPFFTTKATGTGLGLSICYEIVQTHGGRIGVTSLPGEGSSFTVWFPVPT